MTLFVYLFFNLKNWDAKVKYIFQLNKFFHPANAFDYVDF